jgi:hypothetical protein
MWLIYEIQCRFNKFDEKTVGMDEMTQLRNVQKICDHEFKINFILGLYFDLILRYKHIEITLINLKLNYCKNYRIILKKIILKSFFPINLTLNDKINKNKT